MTESRSVSDLSIYRRLLSYTPWAAFVLSLLGFLLYSVANVSVVQLISYLVDSLQASSTGSSEVFETILNWFGIDQLQDQVFVPVAIVAIVFLRGLGTFLGNYFINFAATTMIYNLRRDLFDQLLKLPSQFYDRNAFGRLVAKLTFHVTQVTGAATDAVKVVFREGFTVAGYLGFLLYLNWRLTLMFAVVAPLIGLLARVAGRRFRKISERIQDSMGDVTHVASEAIQGYREVRTYGGNTYERDRFDQVSQTNRRQSMKMVLTSSIATPVIQLIVASVLAGLVWLILQPGARAGMSTGDVVAFITTGGLLAKPIRQLTEVIAIVQKGIAAAGDIFEVLDEPGEVDSGTLEMDSVEGTIEFQNVSFRYSKNQDYVLNNINFVARPGETVALVGRSGGGKSTLAALISRFYNPTEGQILLDGHPIKDFSLDNLRKHLALVSQKVTLFNDSVERNIAYGALSAANKETVIKAAKDAHAWPFIEKLSEGLATVVGDNGLLLSGGQRQRLAIARALLKDAPVLILDEATSALDTESERAIQSGLEAVVAGRTTFIIAHRLSTIEGADKILVLDNGNIVEQGTHLELLDLGGYYAQFYENVDEPEAVADTESVARQESAQKLSTVRVRNRMAIQSLIKLPNAWYENAAWLALLAPLSWLFETIVSYRRRRQRSTIKFRPPVPVLVIGNLTVGGTGKTPLVIELAKQFTALGLKPGVISRGYGGSQRRPLAVTADSDPEVVGDEAVLIANSSRCPVVIGADRVAAIQSLLRSEHCDVIISDDGLQHYRMHRDAELMVIDGQRGFGNERSLPAGPMREPKSRMSEVDWVIVNGEDSKGVAPDNAFKMDLEPQLLTHLRSGKQQGIEEMGQGSVHGVAGIGNPTRFFSTLRQSGLEVMEHPFPDHHRFTPEDLMFADNLPVIITEKDAIKCRGMELSLISADVWVLSVSVYIPSTLVTSILDKLELSLNT